VNLTGAVHHHPRSALRDDTKLEKLHAAAVVELGSFDAAAERLHVMPSAVSQRIKALEQRVGQALVVRERPCTATTAGEPLLRLPRRPRCWRPRRWRRCAEAQVLPRELRWPIPVIGVESR
jgi:hypothetical protein